MKKILYLHAGAEMYGADKVLLDLLKNLDKTQFTPYVVLPTEGVLVEALKKNGIPIQVMKYPIMRRKYFNIKGVFNYIFDFFKFSRKLTRFAKENSIDIIHTNTAAVLEGCYVSKRLHLPQLWSIHEIIVSPQLMYKFTSKIISRYSAVVVTDSMAVKKHLEKSGYFTKNQPQVIYNGVDSDRFKPSNNSEYLYNEWNIPKNAKIIGMMGRVNSWKGQHDFLKAAELVMRDDPSVYTVMVGSAFVGEEWREEQLREKIDNSPYKNRIVFVGYRTDSEAIYKLLDVFVLPSTRPDPLPTVVLEAMATGKPIVGYRHGGVCEMVKDGYNGLLADVGLPEDLANKVQSILNDNELRTVMGKRSRSRLLENFSLEAYVNNYSKQYLVL
ncbi:glycosyltransferase family 4 protein [Pediococcus parvulus]|uniref:glycosyltransferase family 4 protein n=1 Tax=Pediococcus parvulus TaxID=54062 RepID=UPI0021A83725|nr:glycosyltransferase family 4 protein [Pediococcus parvulus]MCT3029852.1 glycosyltransferase family 1 protein [Pediococcus parvulus]